MKEVFQLPVPDCVVTVGPLTVPKLIVEVRPPATNWPAMYLKIGQYLGMGARVVVIDRKSQTVSVYHPDRVPQILHVGDDLTIPDVLPGFAFRIQQLSEL